MSNEGYWNFRKSRYDVIGNEVRDINNCCEDCEEEWAPLEIDEDDEEIE